MSASSPTVDGYADFVAQWAGAGRTAMTSERRSLTYDDWIVRGDQLAAALAVLAKSRPARVATLLPNGPELLVSLYACARAGLTLVPLSTWSTASEIERVLEAARPAVLLTSDEFHSAPSVVAQAVISTPMNRRPSVFAWTLDEEVERLAGLPDVGSLLGSDAPEVPEEVRGGGEDDLVVLFTSGSTGAPKGVRLSHRAVVQNAVAISARMGYKSGECVFTNFPLFFSGGLCNALSGTVSVGGELVTQPRFDPVAAVELIRRRRCTARIVWRDGLRPLIAAGGLTGDDLRVMRRGLLVDPALLAELGVDDDLGVEMYGMTETATAFTCGDARDPLKVRSRTHGTPLPGNEVRVVHPGSDLALPPGAEGEIWVRGPRLFSGYTDGSHEGLTTADGFFRTGDVGHVDSTGHLHYAGRTKTLIKVKGLTVQPEEVEAVIGSIPGVRHVVVVGLGEGDQSEGVGALVARVPGSDLAAELIERHCRVHLSAYKVPAVRVVDESAFPLTATMKPDRVSARTWLYPRRLTTRRMRQYER